MPPSPAHRFRVVHAALSDMGMRRLNNQDSISAPDKKQEAGSRGQLFVVADGMGAHAAGELASKLAADTIPHTYHKMCDAEPQAALRRAVQKANELIHAKGQSSPEFQGMGTTSSCLLLLAEAAIVAHVGDSRVYRFRENRLEQLTFDHSLVWEMAAASHTTADQVPACIPKNVITRSLGPHNKVNVDLEGPHPLAVGDVFLLCSDGLTGVVPDEVLGAVLGVMDPEEAGQTLIDLANLRGGPDNISVVIARIVDESQADSPSAAPSLAPGQSAPQGTIHPGTWLAVAGSLGAVAWFASQQHGLGALVAAAAFGASVVVAWMQRTNSGEHHPAPKLGGPYGNGPYRTTDCAGGESGVEAIAEVVDQLAALEDRDPTETPPPPIRDWNAFHEERQQATEAQESAAYAKAIAHYGSAIRSLMEQVRSSSTVEYTEEDNHAV